MTTSDAVAGSTDDQSVWISETLESPSVTSRSSAKLLHKVIFGFDDVKRRWLQQLGSAGC